jgi:hypothetical protein
MALFKPAFFKMEVVVSASCERRGRARCGVWRRKGTIKRNWTARHVHKIERMEWKKVQLDPQAAWLVQSRISQAAWNITSKSLPVYLGRSAATSCFGNPRVMVSESREGLLQEPSEPEEEMTRKPKVEQGDGGAKEGAQIFVVNVSI